MMLTINKRCHDLSMLETVETLNVIRFVFLALFVISTFSKDDFCLKKKKSIPPGYCKKIQNKKNKKMKIKKVSIGLQKPLHHRK